jgi:hypothetical protein
MPTLYNFQHCFEQRKNADYRETGELNLSRFPAENREQARNEIHGAVLASSILSFL